MAAEYFVSFSSGHGVQCLVRPWARPGRVRGTAWGSAELSLRTLSFKYGPLGGLSFPPMLWLLGSLFRLSIFLFYFVVVVLGKEMGACGS